MSAPQDWTPAEDAVLAELAPHWTAAAARLHRSVNACMGRGHRLGLHRRRRRSPDDVARWRDVLTLCLAGRRAGLSVETTLGEVNRLARQGTAWRELAQLARGDAWDP